MKSKKKLIVLISSLVVLATITAVILVYLFSYYKAIDVHSYLVSDSNVTVKEENDYIFFDHKDAKKAFIFYPGAKVDEKAYAPIIREIADNGVDCYIMRMPCHMAIFNINAADKVYKNATYDSYYIGGHSMGGAMAAKYASTTNNKLDGLIFFAAYSAYDLTNKKDLKVLSIYGDLDGVIQKDKIVKGRDYIIQSNYEEKVIQGGNHALFGSYGFQSGDNKATITPEVQKNITVNAVVNFIK